MGEIIDYYSFAENDREYLEYDFKNGRIANAICSTTQNACEKYLKHIVDRYYEPNSEEENNLKTRILKTHSLRNLLDFLTDKMNMNVSDNDYDKIILADGYYFSSRYPGSDSFFVHERDVNKCQIALETTKRIVDLEIERQQNLMESLEIEDNIDDILL